MESIEMNRYLSARMRNQYDALVSCCWEEKQKLLPLRISPHATIKSRLVDASRRVRPIGILLSIGNMRLSASRSAVATETTAMRAGPRTERDRTPDHRSPAPLHVKQATLSVHPGPTL